MTKLLAVEWDDREIRATEGSARGREISIERILRVPLPPTLENAPQDPREIGRALAALVNEQGWKKLRTLVSIGRSQLELKELSLPPAPDDELPDLVRFQALREFNNLGEDWPLDYLLIPGDPEQPRAVIAAAISPAVFQSIRTICATANLQLDQIVLRPCAASALLNLRLPESMHVRLFVDVLPNELDLTVLTGATPEFMRTARLPIDHDGVDAERTILNEIRRTIGAASNRLHGRRIDRIVLCGDGPNQATLAELIERELNLPTTAFDPLVGCELTAAAKQSTPPEHSHFAPLIGLLVEAAAERAPQIDFVHPHRKPDPPDRRRIWTLAAGLAACVVIGGGYWLMNGLWEYDIQTELVGEQIKQAAEKEKSHKAFLEIVKDVDGWLAGDLTMVAELRAISEKLPNSQKLVLNKVTFSTDRNGSRFVLVGHATNAGVVESLVENLDSLNPPDAEIPPPTAGTKQTSAKPGIKSLIKPRSPAQQSDSKTSPESQTTAKTEATVKTPTKSPSALPVPKTFAVKSYRPVVQLSKTDNKNAKYPQSFTLTLFVDNPGPIARRLGPVPSSQPVRKASTATKSAAIEIPQASMTDSLIARADR